MLYFHFDTGKHHKNSPIKMVSLPTISTSLVRWPRWLFGCGAFFLFLWLFSFASVVFALSPVSMANVDDWAAEYHRLDNQDVSGRLWHATGSFTIHESFRTSTTSFWQVDQGHTLHWANQLLDAPADSGAIRKLGAGRLSISSGGAIRGGVDLLQGSLNLNKADIFDTYQTHIRTYKNTALSYASGVNMNGMVLVESAPIHCGPVSCPPVGSGPYADGLQWVVNNGVAHQKGLVYAQAPIYKLGQGELRLDGLFVGTNIRHGIHVKEGILGVQSNVGGPVTVHSGAQLHAHHAFINELYVRPGGYVQVGRYQGGPGLKVLYSLILEHDSVLALNRNAQHPEQAVVQPTDTADLHLNGVLLIGLKGQGWDPNTQYALIDSPNGYQGEFKDYEIIGQTPKGYAGILNYQNDGLWLGFKKTAQQTPRQPQLPYNALQQSLIYSSHYFPESVRQYYASHIPTQGLSGWLWQGGARQRTTTAQQNNKLHYQMHYFGLNWQQPSPTPNPIHIGLQFGFEKGRWYQKNHAKSNIHSWLIGLSLNQQHTKGLGWHIGYAHQRYRLNGHRTQKSPLIEKIHHTTKPTLNQIYGQIHYQIKGNIYHKNKKHPWQIHPTLGLRWIKLNTPAINETQHQTIQQNTTQATEINLGITSQWTLNPNNQPTTLHTSLKQHLWLKSKNTPLQNYTAWQIGLQHQPHKHWHIQLNTQGRIGKDLRDNAINLMVEGRF